MIRTIRYFLLGLYEFRQSCTTDAGDYDAAYERGRDLAHRTTFRRFDH